jgi:hypothetical protein
MPKKINSILETIVTLCKNIDRFTSTKKHLLNFGHIGECQKWLLAGVELGDRKADCR